VLYDVDKIQWAASVQNAQEVYPSHLEILADPENPEVITSAKEQGISENFIEAAKRSPIYRLAKTWRLALPLHPEYRTLPMVWYIPPLSPVVEHSSTTNLDTLIDSLRIPITYLANLLSAGDEGPVRLALKRLAAIRQYMRSVRVEKSIAPEVLDSVGLSVESAKAIYRLLAIAKYDERFVVPTLRRTDGERLYTDQGCCGFE
jgi:nitrate reductase beta subunit